MIYTDAYSTFILIKRYISKANDKIAHKTLRILQNSHCLRLKGVKEDHAQFVINSYNHHWRQHNVAPLQFVFSNGQCFFLVAHGTLLSTLIFANLEWILFANRNEMNFMSVANERNTSLSSCVVVPFFYRHTFARIAPNC